MLIKSIVLENFLPFQGKQVVNFATDPKRNVTLVMGDNGAGKTSLAQAFEWCLYGRAPKESKNVINAFVRDNIPAGYSRYASVQIELEKNGLTYTIRRSQEYSRGRNKKLETPRRQQLAISYRNEGQTYIIPEHEHKSTIDMLLSGELSHYFFFDGEHVKNMRKEIESGKSEEFAEAVKVILGLQPIKSAIDHLRVPDGRYNSVERWFTSQLDSAGDKELQDCLQRRDEIEQNELPNLRSEFEKADKGEKEAISNEKRHEQQLRDNAMSQVAQNNVDDAREKLADAVSKHETARNEFMRLYRKQHYRFYIERLVNDALEVLSDEDKISKGVPSVDDTTIKFILKQGKCICGTEFTAGDRVYANLHEMLKYVPPKDLGTCISEFENECHVRTEGDSSFYDELVEAYRKFGDSEQDILSAEFELKEAEKKLESIKNIDVKAIEKKLEKDRSARATFAGKKEEYQKKIDEMNEELNSLRVKINENSLKNEKNAEIRTCLNYVDYIYNFLNNFYVEQEAITRNKLKENVNKFFTEMYNGELHLELDENYGVTVVVDNIDTSVEAWKTSSGQTLAIILAFILGILDRAKESITNGNELMKGDTYPLVMDAPLSDFDKTRIGTICHLLPVVAEQVIILIKDTDGELAEEHMRDSIGKRYTLKRISDYKTVIKE